jgi:hypothetical protein
MNPKLLPLELGGMVSSKIMFQSCRSCGSDAKSDGPGYLQMSHRLLSRDMPGGPHSLGMVQMTFIV